MPTCVLSKMKMLNTDHPPLEGLRVLELTDGKADMCGRILADLGADVVLVETREGCSSRRRAPMYGDVSLYFASHDANKSSVQLDAKQDTAREQALRLASRADIFIDSLGPGKLESLGLSVDTIRGTNRRLIVLSISDFGCFGPYRDFQATNAVHLALAGVLARSGIESREPLLPPGEMAEEAAAIQAAWVALLTVIKRNADGIGDHLDYSVFEATAQLIDPGLGVTGSAAGGKTAAELAQRGRPAISPFYPIFPCKDGNVRVCILNPRQWQCMSEWLGDDHPFTDPAYGHLSKRFSVIREINALISAFFSSQLGADLVIEGQKRGIPIAKLATPQEVLRDPHFRTRQTFDELRMPDGKTGRLASGYLEVDGKRCGPRSPAPELGSLTPDELWKEDREEASPVTERPSRYRPLDGIRVLDLGVIVAGAELGRLLSDQGAQVIKIESKAYPDGLRQSYKGEAITRSFTQGSRGKWSFGLNLRREEGIALFKELVRKSDIVLSNFKPGTMESLGLGYNVLKQINPRIIVSDSSALGNSGPRSRSMGYGPLVRAATGLSGLWCYPDDPHGGFSDGITIYPDHFAARVSAVGIASLLLRRERTGIGGTVSVSQAECIMNAMAAEFMHESLVPGSMLARGNHNPYDAPNSVFPCAGTDQWCAVSVRDTRDFSLLCDALGKPELAIKPEYATPDARLQRRGELESLVSAWTCERSPDEVMKILQSLGVPAGRMNRVAELEADPHLLSRLFIRRLIQPGIDKPLLTENGPVASSSLPDPDIRPAPFLGQHTRLVAREVLGLTESVIDDYLESGVLECG